MLFSELSGIWRPKFFTCTTAVSASPQAVMVTGWPSVRYCAALLNKIGKQLGQAGRIEVADHLARGAQLEFALRVGGRGIFDGRLADFPQIAQGG